MDRCLQDNGQCHPDATCADLHFQDSTVGVFHLRSPLGQYKLTFDKAKEACAKEAASIATYNQLSYAQKVGFQSRRHFRQNQQGGCVGSFLQSQMKLG